MIERQIVISNLKEFQVQEYITSTLRNAGQSHIKLQKTPLGEKIVIYASRPGLIVGRKGANIKMLTTELKKRFNFENPQIEINEVENIHLDAQIVSDYIASSMERFGSQRFKGVAHRALSDVMTAGALGVEILISGKIPSSRARRWRFYQGYLKKCGEIALTGVHTAYSTANLKTGAVGIQVKIMPPTTKLPDNITILKEPVLEPEEVTDKESEKEDKPEVEEAETKSGDSTDEAPAQEAETPSEEAAQEATEETSEEKSDAAEAKE